MEISIIICIKKFDIPEGMLARNSSVDDIVIGKQYEYFYAPYSNPTLPFVIIGNDKIICMITTELFMSSFITLEKWREQQLNEVLWNS